MAFLAYSTSPYIQTHIIDSPEADYLYVMLSQIEQAGDGLYTAIDIYEEEIISLFKGKVITTIEAKRRVSQNADQYFINLLDGTIMDCMHAMCFAKFANDAEGFSKSKFKNNAEITLDDDDRVCLKAIRHISAGEEVFCNYGRPYWVKHGRGTKRSDNVL